jgi:bifunctional non-homologous end joining protein LigD
VTWDEVEACASRATELRFLSDDVLERVAAVGDLFADVLTVEQRLPVPGS